MSEPLVHLVCSVISQTAKSTCFLAVRMLQFKTWGLKDITLLIIKTLNKGDFGGNIIFTDIGSESQMAQQSLVLPAHVANGTLPQWLLPNLSADELYSCSKPDAMCILPAGRQNGHQNGRHTGFTTFALGCALRSSQVL